MVCQQKLDNHSARVSHFGAVSQDLHPLRDRIRTSRAKGPLPLHLNRTHPTNAINGKVGMIAQGRDVDAGLLGGLEDRQTLVYTQILTVYLDVNISHIVCLSAIRARRPPSNPYLLLDFVHFTNSGRTALVYQMREILVLKQRYAALERDPCELPETAF